MHKKKARLMILEIFDESDSIYSQTKDLKKLIREKPAEDEANIISYLESGVTLLLVPALKRDLLNENKFIGGASFRTDGVWCWRSYLTYYIKQYHIELPTEFLMHLRKNAWKIPKMSGSQIENLTKEITRIKNFHKGYI